MTQDKLTPDKLILYAFGLVPTVWIALLIAPAMGGGLPELIPKLTEIFNDPFHIVLCEDSLKAVLILVFAYVMGVGMYISTARSYRKREEYGSARWGSASQIKHKYEDKTDRFNNKVLTQNTAIGLDGRKHLRNLNVLVCGGSGAGKTRFYAKPNLMQANSSFVVLDPKGELLRDTGALLKEKGYEIKVVDLIDMENSHCYNPFVYLHGDNDIQKLATNIYYPITILPTDRMAARRFFEKEEDAACIRPVHEAVYPCSTPGERLLRQAQKTVDCFARMQYNKEKHKEELIL